MTATTAAATARRSPERVKFLTDLLTTAVEGGINYWSHVADYEPELGTVTVIEDESEDVNGFAVTIDTIARGISAARKAGLGSMSGPGYVAQFWIADRTNGAEGDYDAEIADSIMQFGLFGELVYG